MKNKFKSVLGKMKRFWKETQAQDLVEYALLLVLVALIARASIRTLGNTIKTTYGNATTEMTELGYLPDGSNGAGLVAAGNTGVEESEAAAAQAANAANSAAAAQAAATDLAAAVAAGEAGRNISALQAAINATGALQAAVNNGSASAAEAQAYNAYTTAAESAADYNSAAVNDAEAAAGGCVFIFCNTMAAEISAANASANAATGKTLTTGAYFGL